MLWGVSSRALLPSDPDSPDPLADLITDLFSDLPPARDPNGDGRLSAADVVSMLLSSPTLETPPTVTATPSSSPTPSFTPSSTPTRSRTPTATVTPTPTITRTPTITPTPGVCPPFPASLTIQLRSPPSDPAPVRARVQGRLLAASCRSSEGWQPVYQQELTDGEVQLGRLHPGLWLHRIEVLEPDNGQVQNRRSLLLAEPARNNLEWLLYAEVFTVRDTSDSLHPESLRSALLRARTAAKPFLIRFDEDAFPAGTPRQIVLANPLPPLDSSMVTIDGFDSDGNPALREIDAGGQPFPALSILGNRNRILGLTLKNSGANDRDVVSIRGPDAWGNLLEQCRVQVAASADGIGIDDRAGSDFGLSANVVRSCEVTGAFDKGIKVTTGATAVVERSWIYGNQNGGVQATLGGRVLVRDSVVETNGGLSAQNGLSANGAAPQQPEAPAWLIAIGNIIRDNGGNGVSARAHSLVVLDHNVITGNRRDGLRAQEVEGRAPWLRVGGSTFACNQAAGIVIEQASLADFGGGPAMSPGGNLFAWNGLALPRANLVLLGTNSVWAVQNLWQSCVASESCSAAQVRRAELAGRPEQVELGEVGPPPLLPPRVHSVRPRLPNAGEPVRVFGEHFVAPQTDATLVCGPLPRPRECPAPDAALCATVGGVSAEIEAVTPGMLVLRMPFPCVEPVPLLVHTPAGSSPPTLLCAAE